MKKIFATLALLVMTVGIMAQNYVISGNVCDASTGNPLEYAVVQLLKGDSLKATALTKHNGSFVLNSKAKGKFKVRTSYVGSDTQTMAFEITGKNDTIKLATIKLNPSEMLGTAEVTATLAKVEQKEDTTQFNASAYRVPEGSTLEALIKQLPGVEVDDNGGIKVNGQTVTEFLINGKDFFKGDTEIAMKNLPTTLVSKIKSYKKKSEYTEMTGIDQILFQSIVAQGYVNALVHKLLQNTAQGQDGSGSARIIGKGVGINVAFFASAKQSLCDHRDSSIVVSSGCVAS
jgi:hypothetical protein